MDEISVTNFALLVLVLALFDNVGIFYLINNLVLLSALNIALKV